MYAYVVSVSTSSISFAKTRVGSNCCWLTTAGKQRGDMANYAKRKGRGRGKAKAVCSRLIEKSCSWQLQLQGEHYSRFGPPKPRRLFETTLEYPPIGFTLRRFMYRRWPDMMPVVDSRFHRNYSGRPALYRIGLYNAGSGLLRV